MFRVTRLQIIPLKSMACFFFQICCSTPVDVAFGVGGSTNIKTQPVFAFYWNRDITQRTSENSQGRIHFCEIRVGEI